MSNDVIKDLLDSDDTATKSTTYVVSAANKQNGVNVHVMSSKELKHFKGDVVEAVAVDAKDAETIAEKLRTANSGTATFEP